MLHQNGNDYVDKNELRHEDKNDEEDGRDEWTYTAVPLAVVTLITFLSERILQTIPSQCNLEMEPSSSALT